MNKRRKLLKQLAASIPVWILTRRGYATDKKVPQDFFRERTLGVVNDVQKSADGIECRIDHMRLRISFVTDQIVRITATQNRDWSKAASLMRADIKDKPGVIRTSDDGKTYALHSPKMSVKLDRTTGAISFWGADGKLLLEEAKVSPRAFEKVAIVKSVPDPATVKTVKTVDGERQVADTYVQKIDRDAWKATAGFKFRDNEALYGLGFDETDDLNLRGKSKRLYQHNLRIVVPFVVSTRGYGLLFDTYSVLTFADGREGTSFTSNAVDDLDYYFVQGPSMDGAIAGYRRLTGAASMLPKWAYGYMQSKERYVTQDEVLATTMQFRDRNIPLDVIVQDWNYWMSNRWGSFVPDATRYPDIAAMTKAVHDMNARVMISIWPNPSPLDPPGKAFKDNGYTLPGTDYVDFFQRKAGDLYFDNVWNYLGRHGIDAWWCDSTEPEVADWSGSKRPQNADDVNIQALAKLMDAQLLNAYALVDSQSLYRNWRKRVPNQRLVNLTRSGYAGSQAVGAVVWTGDISAKWPVLAQQVVALQSFSASGTPYVTFDIGAFFVKRKDRWFWDGDYEGGVADLGYRELYTRWLQLGVFLPMCRSHGADTPREPWHFGEPGTPFYDAILESIHLRYRLLPHIYSRAGLVYLNGASFIRPVAFVFPDDLRTHDLKTQMLFGDSVMLSPVLAPMYYAARSAPIETAARTREVYLPKGIWIDFWTGQALGGGQTIIADAPLARMPIHVRAGSVIPMGPVMRYASEIVDAPIELRVYPGADGEYIYYEDAGDGWGYEHGEYTLTHMRWNDASRKLTIGRRQGGFPGMKERREFQVVVVNASAGRGLYRANQATNIVINDGRAATVATGRR
ncbi:TIM-barrel domain-containing protein [Undibacterium sp. Di26W]|uniref:glycoside hydrolase family 31 protein n=1 Tax=Undibacterium sp. Di26W TaxID=3413035 RepID=UPI003BF024D3